MTPARKLWLERNQERVLEMKRDWRRKRDRCDNRPCVNPFHLFLGDNNANVQDKVSKGRSAKLRGTEQSQAKLTEAQVIEIRRKYKPFEYGLEQLAKDYGVAQSLIFRIVHRKNWRHV